MADDKNTGATVAEVTGEAGHGGSGEGAAQRGPAGAARGGDDGARSTDQSGHGAGAKVGETLREAGDVGPESPKGETGKR